MQATVTPLSRLHFYDMTCEMSVFTVKNTSFPQCTQSVSSRAKMIKSRSRILIFSSLFTVLGPSETQGHVRVCPDLVKGVVAS